MKLLLPYQVRDAKNIETAKEILRIQEINKISEEVRLKMAKAESDFQETLEKQRNIWEAGRKEQEDKILELTKEIAYLEERKSQALIPIEVYETQAKDKLIEAEKILSLYKEKENSVDKLQEILEQRLDDIGEREQNVLKEEKRLKLIQEGIVSQQEFTKNSAKELSENAQTFANYVKTIQETLASKKEELIMQELSLNARKNGLDRKEESLDNLAIKLKDDRETLDRAFQRLNIPLEK